MRSIYAIALTSLLAAGPAMAQVTIQAPNSWGDRSDERAMQDRSHARWEQQEAQRRAAMGDYQGAADAQRASRRNWHDARRQDERSRDEGGIVIGR